MDRPLPKLSPRQQYSCGLLVNQLKAMPAEAMDGLSIYLATRPAEQKAIVEQLQATLAAIAVHMPHNVVSLVKDDDASR
jgi:hypothetical protein